MKGKTDLTQILALLNQININSIEDASYIDRETLMSQETVKKFYDRADELRKIYSSDRLTSLHKNALDKQKYPAINLLRQVLKEHNYKLVPHIINKGYDGKTKIVERYFSIEDDSSASSPKKAKRELKPKTVVNKL